MALYVKFSQTDKTGTQVPGAKLWSASGGKEVAIKEGFMDGVRLAPSLKGLQILGKWKNQEEAYQTGRTT